jgi:Zn-dependent peptidase ImmA (M78 family)
LFIENYIRRKVNKLIKKSATSNPEIIMRTTLKHIDFDYAPLSKNLNGYYLYLSKNKRVIRVNSSLDEIKKQFVLFHETGHCVLEHEDQVLLDRADSMDSVDKLRNEYDANLFASYFFKIHNNIDKNNLNGICLPEYIKYLISKFL